MQDQRRAEGNAGVVGVCRLADRSKGLAPQPAPGEIDAIAGAGDAQLTVARFEAHACDAGRRVPARLAPVWIRLALTLRRSLSGAIEPAAAVKALQRVFGALRGEPALIGPEEGQ